MKKYLIFLLAATLWIIAKSPATATEIVGQVTRIQGEASSVMQDRTRRLLVLGSNVHQSEIIITSDKARIEMTMKDGSIIVLSDNTRFAIDRYMFKESPGRSNILMKLVDGAFRMIAKGVSKLAAPRLQVITPYGVIGLRGTDFWGGYFPGSEKFGVLVLSGKGVYVTNRGGTVLLDTPGQGTDLSGFSTAPTTPAQWTKQRIGKAAATVTFD